MNNNTAAPIPSPTITTTTVADSDLAVFGKEPVAPTLFIMVVAGDIGIMITDGEPMGADMITTKPIQECAQ